MRLLTLSLPITLLGLGLLEGVLRWGASGVAVPGDDPFWKASVVVHRRSADPTLIYELVPGSEAVREGVPVKINPSGFRDDEFPDPIPRIAEGS